MDKAMLEALKKRKMNGAPDLTIMIGAGDKDPKNNMDPSSDLAPPENGDDDAKDAQLLDLLKDEQAEGGMDNSSPTDQAIHSLMANMSEQDKMDLMNQKPRSLMERAKQAQLMNKKA